MLTQSAPQRNTSNHPGVVHVRMADGSVRSLPEDLPPETLRALLSPNGGEKLDLEEFLK